LQTAVGVQAAPIGVQLTWTVWAVGIRLIDLNIANRFVLDGRAGNLQRGQVVKILGRITVGKVARDRNISHFYLPLRLMPRKTHCSGLIL
jgi:hypothetical protein